MAKVAGSVKINPFASKVNWGDSLQQSTEFRFGGVDEISFSVGTGRSATKMEMRFASFLALAAILTSEDFNPDAFAAEAATKGGSDIGLVIETKTVEVVNEDGSKIKNEIPAGISFLNPESGRRVNLPYDFGVSLIRPEHFATMAEALSANDPLENFRATFRRVDVEADPDNDVDAFSGYTFRVSLGKHARNVKVPVENWTEFVAYISRAADYISTHAQKEKARLLDKAAQAAKVKAAASGKT